MYEDSPRLTIERASLLRWGPFVDGNARSAALALYFVLASEGVVLDRAAPLLMTRWPADDSRGAEGLAGFVAALIDQTRRQRPTTRRR